MKIVSAHKFYYDRDGASRYQLEINRLLTMAGHEVIPFAMDLPENLETPWSKYFVSPVQTKEVRFDLSGIKTFSRMIYGREARKKMKKLLEEVKPDVAHIHNIYTQLSPSILGAIAKAKVPAVMTVHDYHIVSPNYYLFRNGKVEDMRGWSLTKSTLSRFHKNSFAASFAQTLAFKLHKRLNMYDRHISTYICPSNFVAERMRIAGYSDSKIRVIPHFIDTAGIEVSQEGDGSVLFVGRFVESKGVRFLLEIAKAMSNTKFVLVGDGSMGEEVRAMAKGLSNLEAPGWLNREQLEKYYKRASVVLVPSLWHEPFGLVALEAMAHGLPVIVSDMGALPEVIENGVTGVVCSAGDHGAWTKEIEILTTNTAKAQEMGLAGRARVEKMFAPDVHLTRVVKVLEHSIKK